MLDTKLNDPAIFSLSKTEFFITRVLLFVLRAAVKIENKKKKDEMKWWNKPSEGKDERRNWKFRIASIRITITSRSFNNG